MAPRRRSTRWLGSVQFTRQTSTSALSQRPSRMSVSVIRSERSTPSASWASTERSLLDRSSDAVNPLSGSNVVPSKVSGRSWSVKPKVDPVLMFKVLVIQAQNNLSDDRAEFLINDRLSFMRFLGLGLTDKVPDAKTIWAFRERLTRAGAIEALFARFDRAIREAGYIPMSGQIVDASLVPAPKQRNTDEEKKAIKEGRVPEDWTAKPAKLRQKDRDARWTLVFGKARLREDGTRHADIAIPVFGYKSTPASTGGTASSGSGT
jgi:transposase